MRRLVLSVAIVALALAQIGVAQEAGRRGRGREGDRGGRGMGGGGFVQRMDADGDGTISRDEYKGPPEAFEKLDADADGSLTMEEARKMMRVMQELAWEKVDRDEMFSAIDQDGDGVVTKDEFKAAPLGEIVGRPMMQARSAFGMGGRGGEGQTGRQGGFLQRLDKDGDGKISLEEVPEERKQMFQHMDQNADGFIDEAEIKQARDRMQKQGGGRRGRRGGEGQ